MKYLFMAFTLLLFSCSTENELYYQTHPQELQTALKGCAQSSHLNCQQLRTIAITTNQMAMQLQSNPQAFGKKILALQESIAKQALQVKTNPELKTSLEKNRLLLAQYLAIVKWLESPESR